MPYPKVQILSQPINVSIFFSVPTCNLTGREYERWKFDSMRDLVTLLGTTLVPRLTAHAIKTCAVSFPVSFATSLTAASSITLAFP